MQALIFLMLSLVSIQTVETKEEITVTAAMVPTAFSDVARSITVLTQEDIAQSGAVSLQEILQFAGLHVRERGAGGVQADISLRGASFEQTLILVNGIKISDPQTGHHLLNIPITISQIQRIEILKGSGARLYGPNAFGGIIHIITKTDSDSIILELGGGESGYRAGQAELGFSRNGKQLSLSFDKQVSDGFIDNTDYDLQTMNLNAKWDMETHAYQFMMGRNEKDFGANRFYHPDFPNQRETTRATYYQLSGTWFPGKIQLQSNVYSRSHKDQFMLDYERPSWYQNNHKTNVYGADVKTMILNKFGTASMGVEFIREEIVSSNLGTHFREKSGLFIEQQFQHKHLEALLGASGYYFTQHGWEVWPGLDLAWKVKKKARFFASIGRSFRLPTFTELYYSGGGNIGNEQLNAEKAWSYEAGYRYKVQGDHIQASVFSRQSDDMIDWVWSDTDRVFRARNFSSLDTRGFECEAVKTVPHNLAGLKQIRLFYAYLHSDLNTNDIQTKYLLSHPRHASNLSLRFSSGSRITHAWSLRYEEHAAQSDRLLLNVNIQMKAKKTTFKVIATNLFDQKFEDFLSVPLPGRWIRFSAAYRFR